MRQASFVGSHRRFPAPPSCTFRLLCSRLNCFVCATPSFVDLHLRSYNSYSVVQAICNNIFSFLIICVIERTRKPKPAGKCARSRQPKFRLWSSWSSAFRAPQPARVRAMGRPQACSSAAGRAASLIWAWRPVRSGPGKWAATAAPLQVAEPAAETAEPSPWAWPQWPVERHGHARALVRRTGAGEAEAERRLQQQARPWPHSSCPARSQRA